MGAPVQPLLKKGPSPTMSSNPTLSTPLKPSMGGNSTTSLDSLVQYFSTVLVRKLFLTSNLNYPCCHMKCLALKYWRWWQAPQEGYILF